ncbi:PucR family transcriptional regulator [Mesobacillus boroniphilus]|uniref:PucR family transcriptional regulator n=1 Tax=Mesobacillus boroniphilus TaxID=308892 RepID=A0A944GX13_9BACI|nr:PucR family transcriptional regulator ligand-binding domain-containing protein [Mesobacillus boroniphilus]MBS8263931.1 PucR family transcriptional regulator [Mesobacillus boroniphilus]
MKSYISVKDLLQRKHFENIEVVAGHDGLARIVKWVHVVDVTKIRNLLNGNELILSTGLAWKEDKVSFLSVVEQLIESQAAGLCIEIGTYSSYLPQEIIDLANGHHFPIILFKQEVPFVEITQDIHTLLINHQYQMISDLEGYSQALNKKLLTIEDHNEILTFIHQYLNIQVVTIFGNHDIQFTPKVSAKEQDELLNIIENHALASPSPVVASMPIQLLGDSKAELIILSRDRQITDFDQLILDRTATALAQFLLRKHYVEEKRHAEETEWLMSWLEGEYSEESIQEYLAYHTPAVKPKGAFVCLCRLDPFEHYSNVDLTYFKLYTRTVFEQQGFTLFSIEKRDYLIFIFLNKRNTGTWKQRMKEGIQKLLQNDTKIAKNKSTPVLGIGKYVEELKNIPFSYQTAMETIRIQKRCSQHEGSYFYDDLHIFRLISHLHKHLDLKEIIDEYLEPVINYDKKYNGKLMETLKTYLACNGSKQETAKRLYVVRQTLYHRIEKLEKLLGKDFMNHEKRLAIEFMLHSYEFLLSSKQVKGAEQESL